MLPQVVTFFGTVGGVVVIVPHVVEPFMCSHASSQLETSGFVVLVLQIWLSTCQALLWTPF